MEYETITELREGDIYRWRWADPERDRDCGPFRSYHCCSQLAVVRDGRLTDTYWHGFDNKVLDPEKVKLRLLGNVADLREISKWSLPYYRREDIVDMRHCNNSHGPIYIRKDAERDPETMMQVIEGRISEARRGIDSAQRDIERMEGEAAKVRAGKLDEVHL